MARQESCLGFDYPPARQVSIHIVLHGFCQINAVLWPTIKHQKSYCRQKQIKTRKVQLSAQYPASSDAGRNKEFTSTRSADCASTATRIKPVLAWDAKIPFLFFYSFSCRAFGAVRSLTLCDLVIRKSNPWRPCGRQALYH